MHLIQTIKYRIKPLIGGFCVLALGIFLSSCDGPVEPSPQPGVLRVNLQAARSDSVIQISGFSDTLSDGDELEVTISEGRVYRQDSAYATLYASMFEFRQEDHLYDVLSLEENGTTTKYEIFETRLPPAQYQSLTFSLTADELKLSLSQATSKGRISFVQPVVLPPGEDALVDLPTDFRIKEQQTTVINLTIFPFESLERFRDRYLFDRKIEIESIKQP